jgi:hypothetical protein
MARPPKIVDVAREEVLAAVEDGERAADAVHDGDAVCEAEVPNEAEVAFIVDAVCGRGKRGRRRQNVV